MVAPLEPIEPSYFEHTKLTPENVYVDIIRLLLSISKENFSFIMEYEFETALNEILKIEPQFADLEPQILDLHEFIKKDPDVLKVNAEDIHNVDPESLDCACHLCRKAEAVARKLKELSSC